MEHMALASRFRGNDGVRCRGSGVIFFSGGVMEFWTEPQMASIHKMLNPRSIAIVGATPRMQYGGRFLAAALKAKDRVRVYAVNPRYDEIMGVKSYASVTDLPEAPDLVAIVVPYDQVLDVLQESHRKGAGSAIVISAGFAERDVDDRRDLQGELGEFARASGMRISGPNCLGLANVKDDIWATASSRGAEGLTGPIGLVCQSGATAFGPFLVRAVENGIGFSYIISTGNEADLDFTDFARYLLGDPDTGLRRTPGGRAPPGPHPQAPSARHRGGIPLGRHQLAHRRHVRSGRSRSAAAGRGGA